MFGYVILTKRMDKRKTLSAAKYGIVAGEIKTKVKEIISKTVNVIFFN